MLDALLWHVKQAAVAFDQLCNALLGGWADETLSSRCWRWEKDGVCAWPRKLVDALLWFDQDHCRLSFESERQGSQLPPELRPKRGKKDEQRHQTRPGQA